MDDLGRIERCYGCVAEYNRCRDEEPFDFSNPWEIAEELDKNDYIPWTFHEGDKYNIPTLYGGSPVTGTVITRNDNKGTVTIRESWMAEDEWKMVHVDTEYPVLTDDKYNERFLAWEYHGHECFINAKDCI